MLARMASAADRRQGEIACRVRGVRAWIDAIFM